MKILIQKILSNDFYKGSIILTAASFLGNILNTIFTILTGRLIGPVGYGEIVTLFSYVALLSAPFAIFSTMIIQKISASDKQKTNTAKVLENLFLAKVRRWKFLFIPFFFAIPFVSGLTNLSTTTALFLIPLLLLSFIGSFYNSVLQGMRLFFLGAAVGIISALIKLTGPLLATVLPADLLIILIGIFLSIAFSCMAAKYIYIKNVTEDHVSLKPVERRLISILKNKQFIVTAISIFGLMALSNIDIIFVKKFYSPPEVGIYGAWSFFAKIILYAIGPITSVTLVYFSSNENLVEQNKTLILSLLLLLIAGVGGYVIYSFFGRFVVELLLGTKFLSVVPLLPNAGIFGILYSGILLLTNYFLAKKSYLSLIVPTSMIAYCIMLFLIPHSLQAVITLNIFYSITVVGALISFYFYESTAKKSIFRL